jgi:hypothetical protein
VSLISSRLPDAVVKRARNRCEYCHLEQDTQVATFPIDHVLPRALDGETDLNNLAMACPRCNSRKWKWTSAVDPDSHTTVPLFNPRTDVWAEHFRWSETGPEVLEALTPTGRATLMFLDLNSTQHVAIRRWLILLGQHPPLD